MAQLVYSKKKSEVTCFNNHQNAAKQPIRAELATESMSQVTDKMASVEKSATVNE